MLSSAVTFLATAAIYNLCGTGTGRRVCMAERSICWTRSHQEAAVYFLFAIATLALADFTTQAFFFFFAPGRQEHSEAHPNLLRGDNDGFASEPRHEISQAYGRTVRIILVLCQKALRPKRCVHRNMDAKLAQFCKTSPHRSRCGTVVFCTMTLHKKGNTHLFPIENITGQKP